MKVRPPTETPLIFVSIFAPRITPMCSPDAYVLRAPILASISGRDHVSGAGGRYPSALCGLIALYSRLPVK
jgi:hypothetical protein